MESLTGALGAGLCGMGFDEASTRIGSSGVFAGAEAIRGPVG